MFGNLRLFSHVNGPRTLHPKHKTPSNALHPSRELKAPNSRHLHSQSVVCTPLQMWRTALESNCSPSSYLPLKAKNKWAYFCDLSGTFCLFLKFRSVKTLGLYPWHVVECEFHYLVWVRGMLNAMQICDTVLPLTARRHLHTFPGGVTICCSL